MFFGRAGLFRFDAPEGEYGMLYCGSDPQCAFIETMGRGRDVLLDWSQLERYALARLESSRLLRLVDLTGSGLARLGADERLASGDYLVAQRWALALHDHPEHPDGLYYRARHDPSRFSVAMFDRASGELTAVGLGDLMTPVNADLLADLLSTYGFGLP